MLTPMIQWTASQTSPRRYRTVKRCWALASFALVVLLTLASCGAVGGSAGVTGTWDALVTVTGGTQLPVGTQYSAVFLLIQSDKAVSGTFVTEGGASGQLDGLANGETYSFTVAQEPPCLGEFSATATLSTVTGLLQGSYSGTSCEGTLEASFVATRR